MYYHITHPVAYALAKYYFALWQRGEALQLWQLNLALAWRNAQGAEK